MKQQLKQCYKKTKTPLEIHLTQKTLQRPLTNSPHLSQYTMTTQKSLQKSYTSRPQLNQHLTSEKTINITSASKHSKFDKILDDINIYNNQVEKFNQLLIKHLELQQSNTHQEGGGHKEDELKKIEYELTNISNKIDSDIDKYIQDKINLNEIFEKTQYYWYDEHLKKETKKQPNLIKSLLQRFKKKVIPLTGVNKHFYNKKLEIKNITNDISKIYFLFLITQENTYIESLNFIPEKSQDKIITENEIPCYVCFNEHPFNKTYIDTENESVTGKDIEDEKKTYHIWIKVENQIYIFSRPELKYITKNVSPTLLKNLLIIHPYFFFEIADESKTKYISYYDNLYYENKKYIKLENISESKNINDNDDKDIKFVPFLQGNHYLCWLCTILNIIKIYNLYHPQNNFIKEEYQDLITKTMKTQSVLDFIIIFLPK